MNILSFLGALAVASFWPVCQQANAKLDTAETPITQTKHYNRQIDLDSESLQSDTTYLFVAKNYENNGDGTFYNGDYTKENCYHYAFDTTSQTYQYLSMDFTLISSVEMVPTRIAVAFQYYESELTHQNVYWLSSMGLSGNGQSAIIFASNGSTGGFQRNLCGFIGKNFVLSSSHMQWIINDLFDIYTFDSSSFVFNPSFNYNAPYNYATSSTFVAGDFSTGQTKVYDLPWFYTNGLAFNRIQLNYTSGVSTRYITQNGELAINEADSFGYYNSMVYINTATQYTVAVNLRNYSTMTDSNGDLQYFLNNDSQWINPDYRSITFSNSLTPQQTDKLSVFNTNLGAGYIDYNDTVVSDIGLGEVFTLIGSAFGAVGGFLAIQIMPGLSLGLLLFTPLIVGIIIAIIWLVKR